MKKVLPIVLVFLFVSSLKAQEINVEDSTEVITVISENSKPLSLTGGARMSAFMTGNDFDYPSVFTEFQMKSDFNKNNALFVADLRLRAGLLYDETYNEIEVKELYAGYQNKSLRILAGNQIVLWGRTDGFNAVNYLTPMNYFFLSSDPDDQLMSNMMLRIKYQISKHIDFDLVGIPFFKQSVYRYDLFKINDFVFFDDAVLPAKKFENGSLAGRLNFEFPFAGFALSYFQGYDPYHGFDLKMFDLTSGTPIIMNSAKPYFKRSIGLDFEVPVWTTMIRGEVSYNHTNDYKENMYVPNSDLAYIAGLEKDFFGVTAIVQYVGKYTTDFTKLQQPNFYEYDIEDMGSMMKYAEDYTNYEMTLFNRKIFHQEYEFDHAVVAILAKSFFYETLNAELSAYYNISSEEFMIRPKLLWKANDYLNVCLGGVYMHGPEKTLFDYSGKILSGVFAEVNVKF